MQQPIKKKELSLQEIHDRILYGVPLAFEKMWEEACITNREMVFMRNGKIIKMRARDVVAEREAEILERAIINKDIEMSGG